ncbi:unnamed protein product [Angiostrongylus costaricensis]|uniref:DNA topoisomerase (ATP-hydrolyzing) n=1 Tax=Angiostrongylus costaricensis TaxID=334426 RepID=A0A0R3PS90_ANGCS|nr:unnamed protein product [Angiostrongylus costaricensis]
MRRCVMGARMFAFHSCLYNSMRPVYCSKVNLFEKIRPSTTDPIAECLQYERKSPIEHILLRPDTYVGSTVPAEDPVGFFSPQLCYFLAFYDVWVISDGGLHAVQMSLTYSSALLKIFDEILVNAADNKQRDAQMDEIKVNVDR